MALNNVYIQHTFAIKNLNRTIPSIYNIPKLSDAFSGCVIQLKRPKSLKGEHIF